MADDPDPLTYGITNVQVIDGDLVFTFSDGSRIDVGTFGKPGESGAAGAPGPAGKDGSSVKDLDSVTVEGPDVSTGKYKLKFHWTSSEDGSTYEETTNEFDLNVSSVEVVDNLNTDDATKALSAKQGKTLNDNKLNKNLGSANSGKILKVGATGEVEFADASTVGANINIATNLTTNDDAWVLSAKQGKILGDTLNIANYNANKGKYLYIDSTGKVGFTDATNVTVDSALSSTSTNPVQNKIIYSALEGKVKNDWTTANSGKILKVGADGKVTIGDLPSAVDVVNDLTTGGTTKALSAEQGKVLNESKVKNDWTTANSGKILKVGADGKVTIGDLPSAVDVVNDLTTGGTTKALSAEQGKTLKGLVDGKVSTAQGAENAGKILKVNTSGNLELVDSPAAITVDSVLSSTSTNPVQNKVITNALGDYIKVPTTIDDGQILQYNSTSSTFEAADLPAAITVDSALSSTSTNPVQNKIINSALASKVDLNQGAANEGKILKVNASGNLALADLPEGVAYTADDGIKIDTGNIIKHTNSITAETTGKGSATAVPIIKYDAQGHITGVDTTTIYPPTSAGTAYQYWRSDADGAGVWETGLSSITGVTGNDLNKLVNGTALKSIDDKFANYVLKPTTSDADDGKVLMYDKTTNGFVLNSISGDGTTVVDSLTSDSTTDALSAKQGKVLKGLIDGMVPIDQGTGTDNANVGKILKVGADGKLALVDEVADNTPVILNGDGELAHDTYRSATDDTAKASYKTKYGNNSVGSATSVPVITYDNFGHILETEAKDGVSHLYSYTDNALVTADAAREGDIIILDDSVNDDLLDGENPNPGEATITLSSTGDEFKQLFINKPIIECKVVTGQGEDSDKKPVPIVSRVYFHPTNQSVSYTEANLTTDGTKATYITDSIQISNDKGEVISRGCYQLTFTYNKPSAGDATLSVALSFIESSSYVAEGGLVIEGNVIKHANSEQEASFAGGDGTKIATVYYDRFGHITSSQTLDGIEHLYNYTNNALVTADAAKEGDIISPTDFPEYIGDRKSLDTTNPVYAAIRDSILKYKPIIEIKVNDGFKAPETTGGGREGGSPEPGTMEQTTYYFYPSNQSEDITNVEVTSDKIESVYRTADIVKYIENNEITGIDEEKSGYLELKFTVDKDNTNLFNAEMNFVQTSSDPYNIKNDIIGYNSDKYQVIIHDNLGNDPKWDNVLTNFDELTADGAPSDVEMKIPTAGAVRDRLDTKLDKNLGQNN